jgi:hypothetical protein
MMTQKPVPSLWICVVMDLIGFLSYGLPVIGEISDFVWAPISALLFFKLFGGSVGMFGGLFNFIEEILPGLDFIPTFTISRFAVLAMQKWQATKLAK